MEIFCYCSYTNKFIQVKGYKMSSVRGGARVPVSRGRLIIAVAILVGVLFLARGYFQNSSSMLYAGLIIILAGVLWSVVKTQQAANAEEAVSQERSDAVPGTPGVHNPQTTKAPRPKALNN
jgi:hypothetical protein